ncbi:MAG: phosphoglycerate dehydrogenase [Opitutales bacterium]|nr:phosphoglycerate dehydrogenase [Opitutales bacterium]
MKILVADKIAASGVELLRSQQGFEVIEAYDSTPEQLKALAHDVDAIIVRSASEVTAEIIDAAPNLKAVGRAGVGVDNIDVDAATARGVIVMNTPGGNTIATCELAFTHLLCSARPIVQADASMRRGEWNKKAFSKGAELRGKTLGILGLGRIGRQVGKRARAFEMKVIGYDPYVTEDHAKEMDIQKVSLDELFAQADFITVHMPRTDATYHMINKDSLAKMKDGVRIVNCARGGLIKEDDLIEAVKSGKVAYAGLDVFETEPVAADHALRSIPNIVLTPHLGASTTEAQESVGIEVAELIVSALRDQVVLNAVNMPSVDQTSLKALRPYLALGEGLGALLQQVTNGVVSMEITFWGKINDFDTMPLKRAIQRGYLKNIVSGVNDVNAPRCMNRLGISGTVTSSTSDADYTELVRVAAKDAQGNEYAIEGTLIGKNTPRVVHVNGRDIEFGLEHTLLIIENNDVPGIVGMIGTVLAKHGLNIANMSLSRNNIGGLALNVCTLDSLPAQEVLDEIKAHKDIVNVYLVDFSA